MKTITLKLLQKLNACDSAIKLAKKEGLKSHSGQDVINRCMELDHFDYANWLIVRLMSKKQKVQYAVFAAEQVIDIYEKKYPDDERPRKAIEAAKDYLKSPSKKTKAAAAAAYAAAAYADAAANAAYAAYNAAYADAAADAAVDAAYNTADAATAGKELQIKIIEYGKNLIK